MKAVKTHVDVSQVMTPERTRRFSLLIVRNAASCLQSIINLITS
jgi:hypothetical protein